jgi:hypothetical protein
LTSLSSFLFFFFGSAIAVAIAAAIAAAIAVGFSLKHNISHKAWLHFWGSSDSL